MLPMIQTSFEEFYDVKCVFIKCETWMIKHTFKEIKEGLMLSTFAWELEGV